MKYRIRTAVFLLSVGLVGTTIAVTLAQSQQAPVRLTLEDAIHRALQANLSVLEARTRTDEDQGTETRSQAALLPRVNAQTYANYQNRDLRAFGISVPGLPLPNVVGPFSNYDFRIYAQQNLLD